MTDKELDTEIALLRKELAFWIARLCLQAKVDLDIKYNFVDPRQKIVITVGHLPGWLNYKRFQQYIKIMPPIGPLKLPPIL